MVELTLSQLKSVKRPKILESAKHRFQKSI